MNDLANKVVQHSKTQTTKLAKLNNFKLVIIIQIKIK